MIDDDKNLIFEKFKIESDLDYQRALFNECFPENHGTSVETVEHYSWKFHSFPFSPPSYEYVAKSSKEIIGYYAALPYQYKIFGKNVTVGMVCDVMTGIKARGKGVFTKLGIYSTDELKKEGIAFTTGYPIRQEVIPGHLKAGWEIKFDLPLYISFLKSNSLLKKKSLAIFSFIPNSLLKLFHFVIGASRSITPDLRATLFTNKEINSIDGFEEFLLEWGQEKLIVLEKSISFLLWRLNAPGKMYELNILQDKKKIVGAAITRYIIKEGIPSLAILDFMVIKNNRRYSNNLHRIVHSRAKSLGAEAILVMTNRTNAGLLRFLKNGFFKSPYKFRLIIKTLNINFEKAILKNEASWNLMWIDSDDL